MTGVVSLAWCDRSSACASTLGGGVWVGVVDSELVAVAQGASLSSVWKVGDAGASVDVGGASTASGSLIPVKPCATCRVLMVLTNKLLSVPAIRSARSIRAGVTPSFGKMTWVCRR